MRLIFSLLWELVAVPRLAFTLWQIHARADRLPLWPAALVIGVVLAAAAPRAAAAPTFHCADGAITCVEIEQKGSGTIEPVTFGQVFRAGDVKRGTALMAEDAKGNHLALQLDQPSSYPDGTLRFAILSTVIPNMRKGETRLLSILPGSAAPPAAVAPAAFSLNVALQIFSPQMTIIKFGNRVGHDPGIPFGQGQSITLHLDDENFSLTLTPAMAGGDFSNYQAIARAFVDIINRDSHKFHASWNGAEAGSEEDLWLTSLTRQAFNASFTYTGAAKIAVIAYQKPMAPEAWTASLNGSGQGPSWLSGAVAQEQDINLPLLSAKTGKPHPLLSVHVHLRHYPGAGAMRADLVLENDWSYAPDPQNITYDIVIRQDGKEVFSKQNIIHSHHARWHALFWSKDFAEPVIRYDVPYFVSSAVVPHYDSALRVADAVLDDDARALAKADTSPMGTGTVTLYMPTTGMRADIGPLPAWTAQYLLSMDSRARALMFANADAGATMPLHYRDQATGLPVSLDRHPRLVMMFGKPSPQDAFPTVDNRRSPWALDSAHLPSLPYVPYLLTGDLFYLDEVRFFANWVMGSVDPDLRGNEKGLLWGNQVRATAWSLRTLGQAAIILPDADPMKAYFNVRLQNNLNYYLTHFARNSSPTVSPLGILENVDQQGIIGPWQYDFFFLSVADLARAQIPNAAELARWMARFVVGRWSPQAEEQGYCHQMAPAYYVKFRDPTGRPLPDFGAVFRANWPQTQTCPRDFLPDSGPGSAEGYVANSYAALGAAALLGIPGAREAQSRIARESPAMLAKFSQDPTFDIAAGAAN